MAGLSLVEAAYAAFSPTKLTLTRTAEEATDLAVTFAHVDGTEITTFNVEFFGLTATIDLSNVMRYLFTDSLVEIGSNSICKVYYDYRLHRPFGVRLSAYEPGYYLYYTAVNAVLKPGIASTAFAGNYNKILTGFSKYYFWPGYTEKSVLSFLTNKGTEVFVQLSSAHASVVRVLNPDTLAYAQVITMNMNGESLWEADPLQGIDIMDTATENTLDYKEVVYKCIPENPCFMRWVNAMGGWDHWMFSGKQEQALEASEQVVFQSRVDDNVNTAGNYHTIAGKRMDLIKVGSQGVSTADLKVLVHIVVSPLIQMYDSDNSIWVTVLNAGSKPTWDSNEPLHTVEFQFKLPVINVQTL